MTEEMKLEADLLKAYDAYVDANKKLSTSKEGSQIAPFLNGIAQTYDHAKSAWSYQ